MLIVYPFAFLTGAFGFSVAGAATKRRHVSDVSSYLIPTGVAAGLVAAVPGVLDYLGSVPPRSSANRRAATHGLLNTAALGLFTTGWLVNRSRRHGALSLALQGVGTAAMSAAGYMGGTLVYRNQIGVDHRYANAGKWREEWHPQREGLARLAATSSLEVDQMKLVHAAGTRVAVARTEDGYAAFDDRCPHRGGPLSDGVMICGTVQCPWHGSQFDVRTGEVKCGPAEQGITTEFFPI